MPDKNMTINITGETIFKTVAILFLFGALYYLRSVVLVILTSIVIASFIELILQKVNRFNFNRTVLVVLIYIFCFSLLFGLFYVFMPVFLNEISGFSSLILDYFPASKDIIGFPGQTIEGAKEITQQIAKNLPAAELVGGIKSLVSRLSGGFFDTLLIVFGGALNLILIVVISFYLSIQERGIENFLRIVIPAHYEDYVVGLWKRADHRIGLWVQGQFVLSLIVGVLTYLGLMILGVKYALVLALITAIFELIPFGIILAIIPALFFSFMTGGFSLMLWVLGFYIIIQQFENYLLQPLVIKKVVGVSPLVVILALLIGGKLAGFWGIILGIPVAVAILEFLEDLERHKVMKKEVHNV